MSTWIFEPGHTEAEFRARHMMVTWVRGLFKDVHGRLELAWDRCLEATFEGEIDAAGIWTGEPQRDEHLRSADFLDVDHRDLDRQSFIVAAEMHDAVDEQRRGAAHLTGLDPAPEVSLDPVEDRLAAPVAVELPDIQPELARIAAQILVLERLLTVKEQLVHLPEPALERGRLRRPGRG